jgi:hypothetical protein
MRKTGVRGERQSEVREERKRKGRDRVGDREER